MAKSVLIYTSPTCAWCKKTKEFFQKNKVKYQELNVVEEKYAEESQKKSGQIGVPVIDIDGTIIIGFDVERIKEALKL